MRILMMGTGPFAVPTFRWLLESKHDVPALVTRPPRATRGKASEAAGPMQAIAESHGLPVLMPESINSTEAHAAIRQFDAELFVVCDYGQILSRESLALAPRGGINLHGSLLPKYRGAAPVHWAILSGDVETGVSVIHMTPRLDGGPLIAVRRTPIGPDETTPELEARLAEIGVDAVTEAIDRLSAVPPEAAIGEIQDASQATKAPRLSKADGAVNWSHSAVAIRNRVRALKPWPGTYTHWLRDGKPPVRLILDWVSLAAEADDEAGIAAPVDAAGLAAHVTKSRLLVATGQGLLSIDRVQPAGKGVMDIDQWLRGHDVAAGDRFGNA